MTSGLNTAPSPEVLAEVALTQDEYLLAVTRLGRAPNGLELGIIGALWSEHCGYKTSRPLLAQLPTTGPGVLQGPGENAGAVDIGDGLAVVFKIESHNHPSAIEPYEGAATGVGGILRDIFTMGARPIALLDSLRFGPLQEPWQRHLFEGVVAGIGGYGNCIGVPTVGGEVYFDEGYRHNCLVNAMCVGVVEQSKLTRAVAAGPGNPVLLVGADTGRDGIHGATFASVELSAQSQQRRPAVQVGNPFLEKCLLEACLPLAGDPRVVAMQDLGAAGLTSATAELAHRGGCGMDIDVAHVPRRETGMSPYQVMLSESQERMLLVVGSGHEQAVQEHFDRWDLHSEVIGRITDTGHLVVRDRGFLVCDLALDMLIDEVPLRHPDAAEPAQRAAALAQDPLPSMPSWSHAEALLALLGSPNIGSRRSIFRTYDHQVGADTVIAPGGDAALLRVRGTRRALALSTDGNARVGVLDPRGGAALAVCEAARNVVATGARPLAVTNCLNFGNPEKPEVFWQLREAVAGIAQACTALGTPVVSGNVSLYNDTGGVSIPPTTVIGMVGLLDDIDRRCTAGFTQPGDVVAVLGALDGVLGGSEFQRLAGAGNVGPRPALDLDLEVRVQRAVLQAIHAGLLHSAHDVADGGLAVTLTESCLLGALGAMVQLPPSPARAAQGGAGLLLGSEDGSLSEQARIAGILFGESPSRFLVSYGREAETDMREMATRHRVPLHQIGAVGGDRLMVEGVLDVALSQLGEASDAALARA